MSVFAIFLFSFLSANATLDKSGHLMFVEYSINQPTKDEGETYKVARHRYPEPITSIVDTFPLCGTLINSRDLWR